MVNVADDIVREERDGMQCQSFASSLDRIAIDTIVELVGGRHRSEVPLLFDGIIFANSSEASLHGVAAAPSYPPGLGEHRRIPQRRFLGLINCLLSLISS